MLLKTHSKLLANLYSVSKKDSLKLTQSPTTFRAVVYLEIELFFLTIIRDKVGHFFWENAVYEGRHIYRFMKNFPV